MNNTIALTPYLNNRSYFYHTAIENCDLVQMTPRESIKALKDGVVQAGVIPVAGLSQLGDQFELLGNFGIASEGPVLSVLFFSRIPFDAFTSTNTIRLSCDSVTSINLLGLLFGYQLGFDSLPQLTIDHAGFDGELLIGNRALYKRWQGGRYSYVMDLSSQWTRQHKLPFVFARWVINKDVSEKFYDQLKQWLSTFVKNETNLHRITAEKEAYQYRMSYGQALDYLQGIKTRIGEREQAGQECFLSELKQHQPVFYQSNRQLLKQSA